MDKKLGRSAESYLAVANHCQFLVTGDGDRLALETYAGVEVVSVRAFAERLNLNVS